MATDPYTCSNSFSICAEGMQMTHLQQGIVYDWVGSPLQGYWLKSFYLWYHDVGW